MRCRMSPWRGLPDCQLAFRLRAIFDRNVVTNLGAITLTNVTLADVGSPDAGLDLTACFPTPFTLAPAGQPNSSASCIVTHVAHCNNHTNVVTATGTGFTGAETQ